MNGTSGIERLDIYKLIIFFTLLALFACLLLLTTSNALLQGFGETSPDTADQVAAGVTSTDITDQAATQVSLAEAASSATPPDQLAPEGIPPLPLSEQPLTYDPPSGRLYTPDGRAVYILEQQQQVWIPVVPADLASQVGSSTPEAGPGGIWLLLSLDGASRYQWEPESLTWAPIIPDEQTVPLATEQPLVTPSGPAPSTAIETTTGQAPDAATRTQAVGEAAQPISETPAEQQSGTELAGTAAPTGNPETGSNQAGGATTAVQTAAPSSSQMPSAGAAAGTAPAEGNAASQSTPMPANGSPTPSTSDAAATQSGATPAVAGETESAASTPAQPSAAPAASTQSPGGGSPEPSGEATQPSPTQATPLPTATALSATPTLIVPTSYRLNTGEHVYCIARRYNLNPYEILRLNGLQVTSIVLAGTAIRLPQDGQPFPGARALRPHPATITVVAGDTVYSLACKYGDVDPQSIIQTNGLSAPYRLTTGQVLNIP